MLIRTPLDLGAIIREQRRRRHLGQDDLAKQAGVSRKWIIDVEKGKPRAEIGLILRTFEALGLRLSLDHAVSSKENTQPAVTAPDIDQVLDRARTRTS